MRDTSRKTNF